MERKKCESIFLLCEPNLGIIDAWLPIIEHLKKESNFEIYAIILKRSNVRRINLNDSSQLLLNKLLDKVYYPSRHGFWTQSKNFKDLKTKEKKKRFLQNLLQLTKIHKLESQFLNKTINLIFWIFSPHLKIKKAVNQAKALCYDVYLEGTNQRDTILRLFPNTPKFSLDHGINLNEKIFSQKIKVKNCTIFSYSRLKSKTYQLNYTVEKENIITTGIPRHEPSWISKINSKDCKREGQKYVFLISRPDVGAYFSDNQKRDHLIDIKEVLIEKHGYKLIIKKHPNEDKESIFSEILGLKNLTKTWEFSDVHPMIIGKNCEFAICFYSGVCTDMIAINRPVVEFLDSSRWTKDDAPSGFKNHSGKTRLQYRERDLVIPIENKKELINFTSLIKENKSKINKSLGQAYSKNFRDPKGSIKTISNFISA